MDVFDNFDYVQKRKVKRNTIGKDKGTCMEVTKVSVWGVGTIVRRKNSKVKRWLIILTYREDYIYTR